MHKLFITILTYLSVLAINANAASFDNWKAYMAYGNITDIEPAGKIVYVLSSGGLFSYNVNDGSITTYDKIYPLSDCTISRIAWNNAAKRLIIVYDNNNIDLLDNKANVINISDYYNKSMTVDKTIFNIVINGNKAYLCTAFGLIEIDMAEGLIRETYNIGKTVYNCAFSGNYIYIETSTGRFKGTTTDNLLNPANWKETSDNVSFSHANDINITTEEGYTQYYTYDKTNKCYWSNQSDNKLQAYTTGTDGTKTVVKQDINPVSPAYNTFGFMKIHNGKLYACNGGDWDENNPAAIQIFNPSEYSWNVYDNKGIGEKYGVNYKDIICIAIDPLDEKHLMAGAQTGLYEFYDGKVINHFNDKNSPITTFKDVANDKDADDNAKRNYEIVTSMFFDNSNNLWVALFQPTGNAILTYSSKNGWSKPEVQPSNDDIVNAKFMGYDRNNRIWFSNGRFYNHSVFCYSADLKHLYKYNNFTNEDGTKIQGYDQVRQVTEDKEGNIWVSCTGGALLLTDEYQQDPSKGFYQVKVPRNDGTNYADYLLSGVDITCIAVDNANRKWVGTTKNGVYVISNDNMVQEAHFLAEECSLLSNYITYIAIDPKTGVVYIGTDKGLCSVNSNATETFDEMDKDNVWAYPNPVKPDYTGLITVVGLSFNADVKITTTNGVLVAQGRSTGGSFQWDGRDLKGKRVASGIYMVNTATETGESGTVCKIAVIN